MERLKFSFEGKNYSVDGSAYDKDRITLFDGRILEVDGWSETSPPTPLALRVTETFYDLVEAPLATEETPTAKGSEKEYLVLTSQNGRDTTVMHISPRLLTSDPRAALKAARDLAQDEDFDFVETVYIFAMEKGRSYSLNEMRVFSGEANPHFVFMMWKKPGCGDEPAILSRFNDVQFQKEADGIPE